MSCPVLRKEALRRCRQAATKAQRGALSYCFCGITLSDVKKRE